MTRAEVMDAHAEINLMFPFLDSDYPITFVFGYGDNAAVVGTNFIVSVEGEVDQTFLGEVIRY